jgi:hypothetical protein
MSGPGARDSPARGARTADRAPGEQQVQDQRDSADPDDRGQGSRSHAQVRRVPEPDGRGRDNRHREDGEHRVGDRRQDGNLLGLDEPFLAGPLGRLEPAQVMVGPAVRPQRRSNGHAEGQDSDKPDNQVRVDECLVPDGNMAGEYGIQIAPGCQVKHRDHDQRDPRAQYPAQHLQQVHRGRQFLVRVRLHVFEVDGEQDHEPHDDRDGADGQQPRCEGGLGPGPPAGAHAVYDGGAVAGDQAEELPNSPSSQYVRPGSVLPPH